jgi:GNAT superfamily N-acetyltransferase
VGSLEALPDGRPFYAQPRPIAPHDRLDRFDCGKEPLNDFLRQRALKNEGRASRAYVVTSLTGEDAGAVVAFYTLSTGAVPLEEAPGSVRRNMPNPVPVMVLGRLAVDRRHSGKGVGAGMLRQALQRVLEASKTIGARGLVVHAIDDEAVTFYTRYGFHLFPAGGRTLFLPIETIARSL